MQAEARKDVSDLHASVGGGQLLRSLSANIVPVSIDDEQSAPTNLPEKSPGWLDIIDSSIVSSSELASLHLEPRQKLLGEWFREGDLGVIYAFRGVGKTWFALLIAKALSEAGRVGDWQANGCTKVLYIDGEMPADLMRARDAGLGALVVKSNFSITRFCSTGLARS